jgi:hypothetical protein
MGPLPASTLQPINLEKAGDHEVHEILNLGSISRHDQRDARQRGVRVVDDVAVGIVELRPTLRITVEHQADALQVVAGADPVDRARALGAGEQELAAVQGILGGA